MLLFCSVWLVTLWSKTVWQKGDVVKRQQCWPPAGRISVCVGYFGRNKNGSYKWSAFKISFKHDAICFFRSNNLVSRYQKLNYEKAQVLRNLSRCWCPRLLLKIDRRFTTTTEGVCFFCTACLLANFPLFCPWPNEVDHKTQREKIAFSTNGECNQQNNNSLSFLRPQS